MLTERSKQICSSLSQPSNAMHTNQYSHSVLQEPKCLINTHAQQRNLHGARCKQGTAANYRQRRTRIKLKQHSIKAETTFNPDTFMCFFPTLVSD
ncbi:hypothetical protein BaRGS_00023374 [Batillaria attramentaria]|uniref:Uncharacterized protein n=1 Tax=Batillaria attramentaria TaxID=370345 RepID=A0ABD0KE55_9CAEN